MNAGDSTGIYLCKTGGFSAQAFHTVKNSQLAQTLLLFMFTTDNRHRNTQVGFETFHFPPTPPAVAASGGNFNLSSFPWCIWNTGRLCTNWSVQRPPCCAWCFPNCLCTCFNLCSFKFQMTEGKSWMPFAQFIMHLQMRDGGHKCRNLATRKSLCERTHIEKERERGGGFL